jgi:hypothetical protein
MKPSACQKRQAYQKTMSEVLKRIVYSHAADYNCGLSIFDHATGQAQDQAFHTVKAAG